jgi:hypothetical protein
MQYLLLVYKNENRWAEVPDAQKEKVWEECYAYGEELKRSGHFVSGAPLQPVATAQTVRLAQGKPLVTDGPFAETKEVLAGYHLVICRDIDEAVALGARFPGLKVGMTIEARPLLTERMDA